MKKKIVFAFVLLIAFGQFAYCQTGSRRNDQQCSQAILSTVGKRLGISNFSLSTHYPSESGGWIISDACKVWPKDKSITIGAFAYDANPDADKIHLAVVMVDNLKNTVIAIYEGTIEESAETHVVEESLWLDTARYDLAPGLRAFGLVIRNGYMPTCAGSGVNSHLLLFVREHGNIRPVLEDFELSRWSEKGNIKCGGEDEGDYEMAYLNYTITVGKESSHGYANLLVTGTKYSSTGAKSSEQPIRSELHYDGKGYREWSGSPSKPE